MQTERIIDFVAVKERESENKENAANQISYL